MTWERPDFVQIGMNAEIGGYQSDFDPGQGDSDPAGPRGPILETPKVNDPRTPHGS